MTGNRMRLVTIATLAVLGAMLIPALAPVAGAAPLTPANAGSPITWAFGGQRWVNTSVQFGNATFTSRAFFAEHVMITLTNTSATTRELEGVRTIGVSYFAEVCRPNCAHPNASANLTLRAWQQVVAFVNLTTNATVYERTSSQSNGTNVTAGVAVPALGVLNASSAARGQLNETFALTRGATSIASASLGVSRHASMEVAFDPALGLVPWNVSAGQTWNSSSAFTASGGWNDSYGFADSLHGVSHHGTGSSSGAVSRTGVESVRGKDLGNVTLGGHTSARVIVLGFVGPFALADGAFVTTAEADLFGGTTVRWTSESYTAAQASTSAIDVVLDRAHRASQTAAVSAAASLGSTPLGATSVASVATPSAATTDSNNSVQEQPESPQSAQQASQCLVGGCATPSGFPTGAAVLIGVVGAVGAGAAVAAIAIGLARKPRRPNVGDGNPGS
ncbi:MAG TPA: hypothetical protein VGX00_01125 [Thermoplasmata archaeon]|nr:hypothetical protein [Thermoplasmata archaeon]